MLNRLSISSAWFFPVALFGMGCVCVPFLPVTGLAAEIPEYPLSVVAVNDQIFVADRNLPGIWSLRDGATKVVFQGSKKFRTPLNAVRCLAIDGAGRLLAGDSATREVYRFDEQWTPQPLTGGEIGIPMALAVNSKGDILVSDVEIQRVMRVPAGGGAPAELLEMAAVRGLAVDSQDRVWLVAHGENAIIRVDAEGKNPEVIVAGRAFSFSHHIALLSDDEAVVADGYGQCVWKVRVGQAPEKLCAGEPLKNPVGICRQGEDVLIADPHRRNVYRLPLGGTLVPLLPEQPATAAP